jgi:hypothetical protein
MLLPFSSRYIFLLKIYLKEIHTQPLFLVSGCVPEKVDVNQKMIFP